MKNQLPAGPRMPAVLQTLGTWNRPTAFLSRCRARYGSASRSVLWSRPRMKFSVRPYASLREHTA
jgi:hypothetical protein